MPSSIQTAVTVSPSTPKGLIIIRHEVNEGISDNEILDALPTEYLRLPRHTVTISPARFRTQEAYQVDLQSMQEEQERLFRREIVPLRTQYPDYRVVYFGFAHFALAIHLGYLLEDVPQVDIYQRHKKTKVWRWENPLEEPPNDFVEIRGLPASRQETDGDVVIRLGCSFSIHSSDTREIIHGPVTEIDIQVKTPDVDCLTSPAHLEKVALAFKHALTTVIERLPRARTIHLFCAVPVGLAFRMGLCIKPNVTPRIRTYLFRAVESPRYQRCISIPAIPQASRPNGQIASDEILIDDLRRQIAKQQAVFITGAGVSISASGDAAIGSWTGLLENGVKECLGRNLVDEKWAKSKIEQIATHQTDELILVAQSIEKTLGGRSGGDFRTWLRKTIGSLSVTNRDILDAIRAFRCPILTTNYDSLFDRALGVRSVTWQERALVERVLRRDEDRIVHLHGHWERPESVVLSVSSYEDVIRDLHEHAVLQSLFTLRTVVFVGFGEGLGDPNFGALLEWAATVFPSSEYTHYRLVKASERQGIEQKLPKGARIRCISYGDKHSHLVPFLRDHLS
jgi:hypothetical protein